MIIRAISYITFKKDVEKGERITTLKYVDYNEMALPSLIIFKNTDI